MRKWLPVVFLALSVLAGAVGLKSLVAHTMLANTTSPIPRIPEPSNPVPPPTAR
jgi:hypothetical protein